MIPEQDVKIHICNSNVRYYKNLGYNVVSGKDYFIKVKDLPNKCNTKIKVICDYCGNEFLCSNNTLHRNIEYVNKHACKHCQRKKMEEVMIKKYGENNPSHIEESNLKRKQTCIEKYGNEYQIASTQTRQKIINTMNEKYGVENPLYNKEIEEKSRNTCFEKYGVKYPLQNKEILQKTRDTQIEKYGTCLFGYRTSKQQKYICNLYNAKLNYNIGKYYVDMFLSEEKIFVEYDGGGHNLQVKLHNMSQEEFDKYENERSKYLKSFGYKEFRIISQRDILPDDNILLQIKNRAIEMLSIYTTYKYNIDNNTEYYE